MVEFLHRGAFILQLPSSMQYFNYLTYYHRMFANISWQKKAYEIIEFFFRKKISTFFSAAHTRWKLFLALIRLFTPYLSTILFKNYFPLPSFPLFQMATNELDDCIQIQFEFLWQTQEQKDIFGTSKQTQGRLCSHYSPFKIWRTFLL